MTRYALAVRTLALVALLLAPLLARADTRYAEDPTDGLALPMAPLAGDLDATTAARNPAGTPFLGGWHLGAALSALPDNRVQGTGAGWGGYFATPIAPPFLPRFGLGLAAEATTPPRRALLDDPGAPLRLTASLAWASSRSVSWGVAWHRFVDTHGGLVDGLDTFDAGVAARFGALLAAGLVVRDLFAPVVGGVPLERHYDGEITLRPLGSDALEVAAGALVGERRATFAPRLRLGVRLFPGLTLRAAGELEPRVAVDASGGELDHQLELRVTAGLEVSLGRGGVGSYVVGSTGDPRSGLDGGLITMRLSGEAYRSLVPPRAHLEKLKIGGAPDERQLTAILGALRRIERDDDVRGVFLQLDGLSAGMATIEELREAVARVRARGKKVLAYIIAGGTRDYVLAAACDKIYLDAAGGLRLLGLSGSIFYFKDVFDKLGVVAQFEKIAEYKSAPEAYTMSGPSSEARAMRAALLDDVWGRILIELAHDRGKSVEEVRQIFENGPYTAGDAVDAQLVDAVVEPRDFDKIIPLVMDGVSRVEERQAPPRADSWAYPQVAVVYLEGDIVDGKSQEIPLLGRRVAGGETIAKSIAWARDNPRVEAIVLRVNSPGGSALASDLIAREMKETKGKKPLVVSVGDLAASGGYFAAAPGDVIYAEPSSYVGSIGIFTGKFDLSGLLARLGVTFETARRGSHADMESYLRPYSDEERARLKQKLYYFYLRFVETVAKGRGMTDDEVDAIGRGHVWTGAQGKERRLVDHFGGLQAALAEAKRRAGMNDDTQVELVMLPAEPSSLVARLLALTGVASAEELPGAPAIEASAGEPAAGLGAAADELARLVPASLLFGPTAVQARLPFVLVDE
jgi:protease-4